MKPFDVVIAGGGAAGMMCAIEAGKRGRSVLVLEHNRSPGEKIRISGGGRCNFTNSGAGPANFLSANPKFAISALSRYPASAFIDKVRAHGIAFHEKTLGQLFCDGSAREIIDMLRDEMRDAGVELRCGVEIGAVTKNDDGFVVHVDGVPVPCASLVVATGGKSIPKMGATPWGYRIAEQFGLRVTETRPGLVPLTFDPAFLERHAGLSGVAVDAVVRCGKTSFREALLFTHRGLSGPVILQISSYWHAGETIAIDLTPGRDLLAELKSVRSAPGKTEAVGFLSTILPKRLAQLIAADHPGQISGMNDSQLEALAARVQNWHVKPTGTEGYRTAEVTLGGVDTRDLDARTLGARQVPDLYFIGECVDVTGWLGGYNFQWAWSSGWAAGQVA